LPPDLNLAGETLLDTEIWAGGEATIASTVTEVPAIKRPNEASLLQDDDVETEEMRSGASPKDEMKRPPQDKGLQRAGDLLRGLRKLPTARRGSI
jgi:hypothetical protein